MRSWRRIVALVGVLIVAGLGFVALAPTAIGGTVTYAIVTGSSMEPRVHEGDLVLLRRADRYQIDQVVGYHDEALRRLVLHRIVGRDDGRLVTMGDNNSFQDSARPSEAQVLGEQWLRIPRLGSVVGTFGSPLPAGALVAGIVLLPFGGRRRRRRDEGPPARGADRPHRPGEGRLGAVVALGGVAGALALLAAYAYAQPTSASVPVSGAYTHSGEFTYRADASAGEAFPDGTVRSGQTVYPRLSPAVDLTYGYRLRTALTTSVQGRLQLDLVLADGRGWTRTLPIADQAFQGTAASASGQIRFERLRAIVRGFERESGTANAEYAVRVRARVVLSGDIGGSAVTDAYAATADFRYDADRLSAAASPDGSPAALRDERPGTLAQRRPTSLGPFGATLSVERARAIGVLGSEIALGAALLLGVPLLRAFRRSETDRIRLRWGGRLMEVDRVPATAPGGVVAVSTVRDLMRIADRDQSPVMVAGEGDRAIYAAISDGVLYRFVASPPTPVQAVTT